MTYNFPKIEITEQERTWINAVYSKKKNGEEIEPRPFRVELWDKIPKECSYHIPDFSDWKNQDSFEKGFERLLRDLRAEEARRARERSE